MPLRVLTFNLWGRHGDWTARRSLLRDGLRTLRPHIITFQESIKTPDRDEVRDLLSPEYTVIHQEGRSPDGTGNTIATRLPFGGLRESFLHVTPRVDPFHAWIGSVATIQIRCPDPIGDLLLVHLKTSWQFDYDHERTLQALAAARFIEETLAGRDLHVVLTGDFDATPDSSSVRLWKAHENTADTRVRYVDAWEAVHPGEQGHTFSPRNPLVTGGDMPHESGRRIDYILVRCRAERPSLRVANCFLAFDEPVNGVWASDHFAVVADLEPW